jgi:hypothetical protein
MPQIKPKLLFILYFLMSDDPKLSELAHLRRCVVFFGKLLKELVIAPPKSLSSGGGRKEAREEDGGQGKEASEDEEPESTAQLHEAVLMVLLSFPPTLLGERSEDRYG